MDISCMIHREDIVQSFHFVGTVKKIELAKLGDYHSGDIIYEEDTGTTFLKVDEELMPLYESGYTEREVKTIKRTKCDNCGAPLDLSVVYNGACRCGFCDTYTVVW